MWLHPEVFVLLIFIKYSSKTSLRSIVSFRLGTTGRLKVSFPDIAVCLVGRVDYIDEVDGINIFGGVDEFDACTCFDEICLVPSLDFF